MDMPVATLATTAGAAVLVAVLIQALKQLLVLKPEQVARFGPTLAMLLGLLVAVPAALYVGADVGQAIVNGLFAGAASMGLYDVTASAFKSPGPTA